jgi:hypothetical protein
VTAQQVLLRELHITYYRVLQLDNYTTSFNVPWKKTGSNSMSFISKLVAKQRASKNENLFAFLCHVLYTTRNTFVNCLSNNTFSHTVAQDGELSRHPLNNRGKK